MNRMTLHALMAFGFICMNWATFSYASPKPESANPSNTLFVATYKGKHSGLGIKLTRTLSKAASGEYTLQSQAKSFVGSINEHSRFFILDTKIKAQSYQFKRSVFGKKSIQSLQFNWAEGTVEYRRKDKPEKNADFKLVNAQTLDPSLYQLKLQQELALGKKVFKITFAKDSRIKHMEFQVTGRATYSLNGKQHEAITVERINQPDTSKTRILLVPALNYQIARIDQVDKNGSKYKIELKDYEGNTAMIDSFYKEVTINSD